MWKKCKVVMTSWGGTRRVLLTGLTWKQANEFCEDNDWTFCHDGGYVWDLVIEEDD